MDDKMKVLEYQDLVGGNCLRLQTAKGTHTDVWIPTEGCGFGVQITFYDVSKADLCRIMEGASRALADIFKAEVRNEE